MVVKVCGTETDRENFDILTCLCGDDPEAAGAWHDDHIYFGFSSAKWGDYGVLDTADPTVYNCYAYSMGITTKKVSITSYAQAKQKYRDNCGVHEYGTAQAGTTIYLYGKAGSPTHGAKPWTCASCPCDAISKWGSIATSYVNCHPKAGLFDASPYGTITRWYVPFTISFPATSVQVDQQKTITITVKCGTDAVQDVELEYSVADGTKVEVVGWQGGNDKTDAAGEAKLIIKGKAVGTSNLTVSQTQGDEDITSGRKDTELITVTAAP